MCLFMFITVEALPFILSTSRIETILIEGIADSLFNYSKNKILAACKFLYCKQKLENPPILPLFRFLQTKTASDKQVHLQFIQDFQSHKTRSHWTIMLLKEYSTPKFWKPQKCQRYLIILILLIISRCTKLYPLIIKNYICSLSLYVQSEYQGEWCLP